MRGIMVQQAVHAIAVDTWLWAMCALHACGLGTGSTRGVAVHCSRDGSGVIEALFITSIVIMAFRAQLPSLNNLQPGSQARRLVA